MTTTFSLLDIFWAFQKPGRGAHRLRAFFVAGEWSSSSLDERAAYLLVDEGVL